MEKLRSLLKDLLDEAKPINERLGAIFHDEKLHIDGLESNILTPILLDLASKLEFEENCSQFVENLKSLVLK
jgi:hypothetical protein